MLACAGGIGAGFYLAWPKSIDSTTESNAWHPGDVRENPVDVLSPGDLSALVPVTTVRTLLTQLAPCWFSVKTSRVLHAFRLWGAQATFPADIFDYRAPGRLLDGSELKAYLLDHHFFARLLPGEPAILSKTPYGVMARTFQTPRQAHFTGPLGHSDDLLTACAEMKLLASTEIWVATAADPIRAQLKDMINESMARFSIHQELPWTVEGLARYLAPRKGWQNRFGERYTFDETVMAMVNAPVGEGPCLGTHTVYALACILRIAETEPIVSGKVIDRIARYLRNVSAMVCAARLPEGHWGPRWSPTISSSQTSEQLQSLTATGHHLEWIALAPPELRPARADISKAIDGVLQIWQQPGWFTNVAYSDCYLDLTHLARALCLLLGNIDPNTLVRRGVPN